MEKKVIVIIALGLVTLGAYQAATGGIRPGVDLVEAKAACAEAVTRARAIRAGSPLPLSEGLGTYELILTDCRNNQYLSQAELVDLLGS
ncbi:hypothetical protein [Mesorhizobium neociceri]|uniref:Uncharacterized protein n=1 Tax=Mesorhizobium neociceri TaxID=1307853 RepID=A0A838AXV2_9HYPH|nr:hypothetical protein [Mesorhizobium neociceri]MBA1139368.1 hypothetical protein [Mesorhizobium neociceri]